LTALDRLLHWPSRIGSRLILDAVVEAFREICPQSKQGDRLNLMKIRIQPQFIYSKETMCLGCHLVVRMFHERDDHPRNGAWQCPACGRRYPFLYWKIRKHVPKEPPAA